MNDNAEELQSPHIGEIIATLEGLHQRVYILERALAGIVAFATDEQRQMVVKLIDRAENSYSPRIIRWPEMQSVTREDMAKAIASYKALFSA